MATGKHLSAAELQELGLDTRVNHLKIEFDNDKSVSYMGMAIFLVSLYSFWFPFFIILLPCFHYCFKTHIESRIAVVTETQLVYKYGWYGCFCCCWNEKTKTVPLDKVTDLMIEQGCVQNCFNVKEILVQTASASVAPEMKLVCYFCIMHNKYIDL